MIAASSGLAFFGWFGLYLALGVALFFALSRWSPWLYTGDDFPIVLFMWPMVLLAEIICRIIDGVVWLREWIAKNRK